VFLIFSKDLRQYFLQFLTAKKNKKYFCFQAAAGTFLPILNQKQVKVKAHTFA